MHAIQVGRYNRLLQRLLTIKGDAPAAELAGEIMPVLTLEADRPEWASLGGVRLGTVGISLQPVALQPNLFRIRNPTTSGVVATIEEIEIGSDVSGVVVMRFGTATTDLGSIVTTFLRDQRLGAANATSMIASFDQAGAAASGTGIGRLSILANQGRKFNRRIVLTPGTSIDFVSQDHAAASLVNLAWDGYLDWQERAIEESEE